MLIRSSRRFETQNEVVSFEKQPRYFVE